MSFQKSFIDYISYFFCEGIQLVNKIGSKYFNVKFMSTVTHDEIIPDEK